MKEKNIKVLFHLFVILMMILPSFIGREGIFSLERFDIFIFPVLLLIPFYIINIRYLIPRYLKRGKYLYYILSIIASYGLFLLLHNLIFHFFISPEVFPRPEMGERPPVHREPPMDRGADRMFPGVRGFFYLMHFALMTALGLCFEVIMEWQNQKRQFQETQKEKVSTELSFLKSQINPHFFFNTLNNIYALAAAKADETEEAILLLSNMMRYVLYESGTDKILLSKEVQFIENYLALQKIRFSTKKSIEISFEINGATEAFSIAPMLFLPVVENAFKHGISYKEKSYVAITLEVSKHEILFVVRNSIAQNKAEMLPPAEGKNSGIGLENIKKRLQLLYPAEHEFIIEKKEHEYLVKLKLYLAA